jgi:hypothetical protein
MKSYIMPLLKKGVNTVFLKKKLKMMINALKIWKMKLYEKLDELESAQEKMDEKSIENVKSKTS